MIVSFIVVEEKVILIIIQPIQITLNYLLTNK